MAFVVLGVSSAGKKERCNCNYLRQMRPAAGSLIRSPAANSGNRERGPETRTERYHVRSYVEREQLRYPTLVLPVARRRGNLQVTWWTWP